jgi:hypothetical protein
MERSEKVERGGGEASGSLMDRENRKAARNFRIRAIESNLIVREFDQSEFRADRREGAQDHLLSKYYIEIAAL